MAGLTDRTPEHVRRDIEAEREQLAAAVDDLRSRRGDDVSAKLGAKLPAGRGRRARRRLPPRRRHRRDDAPALPPRPRGQDEGTLRPLPPCRPRLRRRRRARRARSSSRCARVGRVAQAHGQGVHRGRLHGPRAAGRLQLAARVLPGGAFLRRPARRSVGAYDDARALPRPVAPGGVLDFIDRACRRTRANKARLARSRSSSASSARSGRRAARWARVIKAVNRAYDRDRDAARLEACG